MEATMEGNLKICRPVIQCGHMGVGMQAASWAFVMKRCQQASSALYVSHAIKPVRWKNRITGRVCTGKHE
eukprot:scaffold201005_cov19-Tisochrysis_lutea.AAC.1